MIETIRSMKQEQEVLAHIKTNEAARYLPPGHVVFFQYDLRRVTRVRTEPNTCTDVLHVPMLVGKPLIADTFKPAQT